MLAAVFSLLALASPPEAVPDAGHRESVQALLQEESPDVFLARVTLQQYLERVARHDWAGARRLTHPKAIVRAQAHGDRGDAEDLAPWDTDDELGSFSVKGGRSAGAGTVLVEVAEHGESAIYVLFKTNGFWLVGAKEFGAHLGDISDESIRAHHPGWVDHQALTQARRPERASRRPERANQPRR